MIHNGTRGDTYVKIEVVVHKMKNFIRDALSGKPVIPDISEAETGGSQSEDLTKP